MTLRNIEEEPVCLSSESAKARDVILMTFVSSLVDSQKEFLSKKIPIWDLFDKFMASKRQKVDINACTNI